MNIWLRKNSHEVCSTVINSSCSASVKGTGFAQAQKEAWLHVLHFCLDTSLLLSQYRQQEIHGIFFILIHISPKWSGLGFVFILDHCWNIYSLLSQQWAGIFLKLGSAFSESCRYSWVQSLTSTPSGHSDFPQCWQDLSAKLITAYEFASLGSHELRKLWSIK